MAVCKQGCPRHIHTFTHLTLSLTLSLSLILIHQSLSISLSLSPSHLVVRPEGAYPQQPWEDTSTPELLVMESVVKISEQVGWIPTVRSKSSFVAPIFMATA